MTTEKEQLEAEIAQRDERIAELERFKCAYNEWHEKTEWVQSEVSTGIIGASALGLHRADVMTRLVAELRLELAALKAQKPISDMEIEAEGWWNDDHNVYTWPITVGEWGARIECHGRTPAEAQQLALSVVKAQPSAGVVDEREAYVYWITTEHGDVFDKGLAEHYWEKEHVSALSWQARACLDQPTASAGVVVGALVSALEGIVHDERVPNEVSQDYAALLIEARRLNHCRAQAVADDEELKVLRAFYRCCASITEQLADSPKSALARLVEAVKDAAPSAKKESGQ